VEPTGTATDPHQSHQHTAQEAVRENRPSRVLGTAWVVNAAGRKERRDKPLIETDRDGEKKPHKNKYCSPGLDTGGADV